MKVRKESSRLVKPIYDGNPPLTTHPLIIPLSVFDTVTCNTHMAVIYAFKPPIPSTSTIELGLQKALGQYPEWAGRLGKDEQGRSIILLNDRGVRFVEASVNSNLDQAMPLRPSSSILSLHPPLKGVDELLQVQLTRFTCGSMVLGFTSHHLVADGHSTSSFLAAWGRAARGLDMGRPPMHDRTIFVPRDPPKIEFDHAGTEYMDRRLNSVLEPLEPYDENDIMVHKAHFTVQFLAQLKSKAAGGPGGKAYSTFECLLAHLWRAITRARGLKGFETSRIRISVNGRSRLKPRVPNEYFGNLVLWAFPRAKVKELVGQPLGHAAQIIHDAVAKVGDDYYKSFIDFAGTRVAGKHNCDLVPIEDVTQPVLCPNLEVDSWLRLPFYDLDFGGGSPCMFMPTYFPVEGMMFFLPSLVGDGSIDAIVPLFQDHLSTFKQLCYSMD